jgi:OOP family OmpA-OmpF porin
MLTVATILVFAACMPAIAQEAYVGASYLSSSGEFDTSVGTFDPDADGWKIFGGTTFNKFFGMELTYYDLGDLDDAEGANTFSADISVYDLSFRGILPLGQRFELFGKVGYSYVDLDSTLTGPLATATASASDWELIYGAGVALKLGKSFGLRAEWEAWDVVGKLEAYSIGAYWRFGMK